MKSEMKKIGKYSLKNSTMENTLKRQRKALRSVKIHLCGNCYNNVLIYEGMDEKFKSKVYYCPKCETGWVIF